MLCLIIVVRAVPDVEPEDVRTQEQLEGVVDENDGANMMIVDRAGLEMCNLDQVGHQVEQQMEIVVNEDNLISPTRNVNGEEHLMPSSSVFSGAVVVEMSSGSETLHSSVCTVSVKDGTCVIQQSESSIEVCFEMM